MKFYLQSKLILQMKKSYIYNTIDYTERSLCDLISVNVVMT